MDAIVDLSWRAVPATALMAIGLALALYGFRRLAAWLPISAFESEKPVVFLVGLRAVLVGLAIVGVGAAWISQQLWVILIALAIGGEELMEGTILLAVLRDGKKRQAGRPARPKPARVAA